MPRIFLKPNSAEYADENAEKKTRKTACEMPGCQESAEFKAPKDRSLDGYYSFCIEHVQEYNKAWDYFSGMAQSDIEDHMVRSTLGDRPTWRYDNHAGMESELHQKAWDAYNFGAGPSDGAGAHYSAQNDYNNPEREAMAIMGLEPPLSLDIIKKRYKELAKKHHPDLNGKDPESEELLKRINMSYTILKLAHEKYDKLDK